MDLGITLDLLLERGHVLDGSPARDVAILSIPKGAVEETGRAEEPDMATMERRDGSAN